MNIMIGTVKQVPKIRLNDLRAGDLSHCPGHPSARKRQV